MLESRCFVQKICVADNEVAGMASYQGYSPCDISTDKESGMVVVTVYNIGEQEKGVEITLSAADVRKALGL